MIKIIKVDILTNGLNRNSMLENVMIKGIN